MQFGGHVDAVSPRKDDRQEDDVVVDGETERKRLVAIRRDVHRMAAVAQALDDESSDMGMFDNEQLHPGR